MGEFSRVERVARDKPEYYEGLIHAYLYQPMPAGFRNAIKEGENTILQNSLFLVGYLSRGPQPDAEEMKPFKEKSLLGVRRVLQINPEAKGLLRGFWNPNETNPLENDLEVFWRERDSNFLSCLGNPGEAFPVNENAAGEQ